MTTQSLGSYRHTRARGFAPWRPQAKACKLLDWIGEVLHEYRANLPMTGRQLFYRLVGTRGYPKDERAYQKLLEVLNRGRRAGLIPFSAIRDDGAAVYSRGGFDGLTYFLESIRYDAEHYERYRQHGQAQVIELWTEAAGMAPQLASVVGRFGIDVYSAGGFNSTTEKYDAARRIARRDLPTVVLHVGDHDPSGVSIFDSAAADVTAMVHGFEEPLAGVEFQRIAVTPEQIERYALETAPPKRTDNRGNWRGGTVQCEALAPDQLAAEVLAAVGTLVDPDILQDLIDTEAAERARLVEALEDLELGE